MTRTAVGAVFLAFSACCEFTAHAQNVTYDLEVDVVLDTVLYDGFVGAEDVVPAGFRRYNLYAVIPEDALMLGPAADNDSDPMIPPFGYDAGCGCYNWSSLFVPNGYNNAAAINGAFLGIAPELAFDSWWTSHVPAQVPGTSVFEPPVTFATDFDMCSDEVIQGALVVTNADPIHNQVENNRALIGQITTCESFNFRVCVAFQIGVDVFTQCTDGFIEVTDLCAPMSDPQISVVEETDSLGATVSVEVLPNDPTQLFTSTVEYTLWELIGTDTILIDQQVGDPFFTGITNGYYGNYFVSLVDNARNVAWSSNTCRDTTAVFTTIPAPIPGCTYIGASNFDAAANVDDGSCLIEGCMNPSALNYVPIANVSAPCIDNPTNCLWNGISGEWDCAEFCAADINQDGAVSIADLLILLGEFAGGCTN